MPSMARTTSLELRAARGVARLFRRDVRSLWRRSSSARRLCSLLTWRLRRLARRLRGGLGRGGGAVGGDGGARLAQARRHVSVARRNRSRLLQRNHRRAAAPQRQQRRALREGGAW
jgi:hypothetical protein